MKAQILLALLFAAMLAPAAVADKPAAPVTLEGSPATDGSGSISPSDSSWVSEVLFGGVTPPHGFQVQIQEAINCPLYVSDVGPMPGFRFLNRAGAGYLGSGGAYDLHNPAGLQADRPSLRWGWSGVRRRGVDYLRRADVVIRSRTSIAVANRPQGASAT
jgi:hypothetical protein